MSENESENESENTFMNDFKKFLTTIQYINRPTNIHRNTLFEKLYKQSFDVNVTNDLLKDNNKKEWIELFNKIKNRVKPIPYSFKDTTNSTFNKFCKLYNDIVDLLEKSYFIIIQNIEQNQYNPITLKNITLAELFEKNSQYNIENIYNLIENTNTNETLVSYYKTMLKKQLTKKKITTTNNKNESQPKSQPKNESKYNYALSKNNKILIKVRQMRIPFTPSELNISSLFYNLRKCVQAFVLLRNAIKYYYLSKNSIVNEELRTNLLVLIKTLQGSISRSNTLNNNNNNREKKRVVIRKEFKKRMLKNENINHNFVNEYNNESKSNKESGTQLRNNIRKELEINI